ncbi:MAG: membrane protein insertion efficiency factor YidD [Pseudomonadota bacterium]|nr:membrane protein insertion efficiency factor YidD [Pseudomonadota bacterium]
MPQRALVALVRGYRLLLSPWLGSACRFEPTCSAYALEALLAHGAVAGTCLAAGRVLRCHPWCEGGHDPVPRAVPTPLRVDRGAAVAAVAPETMPSYAKPEPTP